MIAVSADDVELFEKTCNMVMEVDPKIRFVGIISQMGKLIAGGPRNGIKLLIDETRHEMIFMEVALRVRMRHEYDIQLGPVNFTTSHRDKIVVISMPYKDKIMYVSAERNIDLCKTAELILELIRRSDLL